MLSLMLKALYVIVVLAVISISITSGGFGENRAVWGSVIVVIGIAAVVMLLEMVMTKKAIAALAGVFLGLLVGIFISWAMGPVVEMIDDVFNVEMTDAELKTTKWLMGIFICYVVISFVMRTKDDVRFLIPYVEFAKQGKGARPLVLDTSVIIDGRIADLCHTKLFDAPLVVPRFVLNELQLIADSADKLKRNRGRRGLDMLNKLQSNPVIEVRIDDATITLGTEVVDVDEKLVIFSKHCDGRLVTNDYNLNKVAQLHEVDVININDLANALKPVVLPGEEMRVKIIRAGEEAQQGIGYLDDGTMVVVENGRDKIGQNVAITITSALQTSAGRMIFGRYEQVVGESDDDTEKPGGERRNNYGKRRFAGSSDSRRRS
ncbi:MAG: TRAM domain-containing protein [Planctomycetota bacterium]